MVFNAGEVGPEGTMEVEAARETGTARLIDPEREFGAVLVPVPGDGPRLTCAGV
jgi:hypothetical protein